MNKNTDRPASDREPWLAHLTHPAEASGEASSSDFIRRVMEAEPSPNAEPWLECLALDSAAEPDTAFAAQVAAAFTQERARRRTLQRMVFIAAELAACAALCAILFWPSAKPPQPVAVIANDAPKNALVAVLKNTATDWLASPTQEANAVKNRTTTLLAKCALPIKATSVLLGIDIPPELQKEMDARKTEAARPGV